jgi:hypothetical protein
MTLRSFIRRSRAWFMISGVAVFVGAACTPPDDNFPWFSASYTSSGQCGVQNYSDPVNIIFDGDAGYPQNVLRATEQHAGWTNTEGEHQNLGVATQPPPNHTNRTCKGMDGQRASGRYTRFHVRIWGIPAAAGRLTAAAAHHEDFNALTNCFPLGHAVDANGSNGSGFDQGRVKLVDTFQLGGHIAEGKWWGNTQNFQQCDGDTASSDGIGVNIQLNNVH